MKAKKVYEFRTSGEIVSMGAKDYKKLQIDKWMKQWLPDNKYEISKYGNLSIDGNVDLRYKDVTYIPDFSHFNIEIGGYLDIYGTKITKLPEDLYVDSWLDISYTNITHLPDNLRVEDDIYAINSKLIYIPDDFNVNGSLNLKNTPISKLPKNLYVRWRLNLIKTNIKSLYGINLKVDNTIYLSKNKDIKIPKKYLDKIKFIDES